MEQQQKNFIKIGIITCSNATQEMDCCAVACLKDFSLRLGDFQRYPPDQELRLVGMLSCAGCPTSIYPEKILRKAASLVKFGVTKLHFANCMTAFCPFMRSYAKAISRKYPEIELIEGTHAKHITDEAFRAKTRCALETNRTMPDVILEPL
jgi:predicted metal-binding protein